VRLREAEVVRDLGPSCCKGHDEKRQSKEARFVTTRRKSVHVSTFFFASVRTKVANDAGDVAATENIALVQHYQRDRESQSQMDVDKVYLR
jgi:hypothetical protein